MVKWKQNKNGNSVFRNHVDVKCTCQVHKISKVDLATP